MDNYTLYLAVSHICGSRIHFLNMVKNYDVNSSVIKTDIASLNYKYSNHGPVRCQRVYQELFYVHVVFPNMMQIMK